MARGTSAEKEDNMNPKSVGYSEPYRCEVCGEWIRYQYGINGKVDAHRIAHREYTVPSAPVERADRPNRYRSTQNVVYQAHQCTDV